MLSDEEKRKIIEEQLKKDLKISEKDEKEIMEAIAKREQSKKMKRKIRWSLFGILMSSTMMAVSFYIALTEKRWLYWFFAFVFLAFAVMDARKIYIIMHPEKDNLSMVKYCAQITDETSVAFPNVKRQNTFPTVEEARTWAEHIIKDGEAAQIIDTSNGKIIGTLKKETPEKSN